MASESEKHRYDDIIDLPHHQSAVHPYMSMHDRAAQFASFAALAGHENAVNETARLTENRIEISEDAKQILNEKLKIAAKSGGAVFKFTYFVPDEKKSGGAYVTESGRIQKIDPIAGLVLLENHTAIVIEDIREIESDRLKSLL